MTQVIPASTPRPWYVAWVCGMASYIDAAAIITFGIAIVIYQATIGLTPDQVGLASAALTFSIAIGALAGGRLGDRFGRRPVFTATMVLIIIGAAALVVANDFSAVLIGAVCVGFATGADLPVSLSTISEAADDTNRGKLLGFSNILWSVGVLAVIIGSISVGNLGRIGGQILFGHIGIVALVVMVARLRIPESATWLAARAERAAGVHSIRADRASVRNLLRSPYAKPFLGLIIFYALVNLAANTTGQFGTYLLVNELGIDIATGSWIGLGLAPLGLILFAWFMKVADSPRRFNYFIAGAVLWIIALAVPAVAGFTLPTYLISAVLTLFGQAFAFEGIMKVWTQESFPTLLRTTAQGTIIFAARIVAALLASVTPALIAAGPTVLYWVLTAVTAIGMAVAFFTFRGRTGLNQFDIEGSETTPAASGSSRL